MYSTRFDQGTEPRPSKESAVRVVGTGIMEAKGSKLKGKGESRARCTNGGPIERKSPRRLPRAWVECTAESFSSGIIPCCPDDFHALEDNFAWANRPLRGDAGEKRENRIRGGSGTRCARKFPDTGRDFSSRQS